MKNLPTVYIETSALSVLVARRSTNPITFARQTLTRAWWKRRSHFALFTSEIVRQESMLGDPRESKKRLAIAKTLSILPTTPAAESLAKLLIDKRVLPFKALPDALHLSLAAVHKMEFSRVGIADTLLTARYSKGSIVYLPKKVTICPIFGRRKVFSICDRRTHEISQARQHSAGRVESEGYAGETV